MRTWWRTFTKTRFWQFIKDSGYWFLIAMGGGFVSLFWLVVGAFKSPTAWSVLAFSVLVFCWGAYKAYSKERSEREKQESRNLRPHFDGDLEVLYLADSAPFQQFKGWISGEYKRLFTHRFVLKVSIVNSSPAPSSVRTFKLVVSGVAGGTIATLEPTVPIEKHFRLILLGGAFGRPVENLSYLMDDIKGKRFEQGSHADGWLGFVLKDCKRHGKHIYARRSFSVAVEG